MISQNSDFIGRWNIANSHSEDPNAPLVGNTEQLQLAIDEYEPECLVTVLGYSLYEELKPELLKQPFITGAPETADDKWVDLVNGKAQWRGLKRVIVPYVYFYFMRDDDTSHTGVGIVRENPKGAVIAETRLKPVTAWREFVNEARGKSQMPKVVSHSYKYVGNVVGVIYSDYDDKYWSLYKFLYENEAVYDVSPSILKNINIYGI